MKKQVENENEMVWRDPRRRKLGLSSKEGGFQNGLATRGLVMIL
jgi:hypothetical protein